MQNKVWISGRVTADIEAKRILKEITSEKQRMNSAIIDGKRVAAVANFTIAVDRTYQKGERDFIHCAAFGITALNLEKYFKKGMGIEIEGIIHTTVQKVNGMRIHQQDIWVEKFWFPPNNERFEVPNELPPMAFDVPHEEPKAEEPKKDETPKQEVSSMPYDYYMDEADADNLTPPEM